MKYLILTVFLLGLGCTLASKSNEYVKLDNKTIAKSHLIQDLQQLGAEYVLEQGIFHSTKTPLPNGSWAINETESVYKKVAGRVTYLNYTVKVQCNTQNKLIRARYTISFGNKSKNVLVTWFIYTDITVGDDDFGITDQPQFIDVQELSEDGNQYQDFLDEGVDYTVADAVKKNKLPAGDYRVARVFSIKDTGFSFPYGYRFLVKLANDDNGKYYRALITVWNTENVVEEDQGGYPPEYVIYTNLWW